MLKKFKNLLASKKSSKSFADESTREMESGKKSYSSVGTANSDVMDIVQEDRDVEKVNDKQINIEKEEKKEEV